MEHVIKKNEYNNILPGIDDLVEILYEMVKINE